MIWNIVTSSISQSVKLWKLILALWAANLGFALMTTLPFFGYLQQSFGDRPILQNVFTHFDFEIYSEIDRHFGHAIDLFVNQSSVILIVYLLFSIFLLGGILSKVVMINDKRNDLGFWQASAGYFLPLVGLNFIFLILTAIILAIGTTVYTSFDLSPFSLQSDMDLVRPLYFILPIVAVLFIMLSAWHDVAKISLIHQKNKNIWEAVKRSFTIVTRKKRLWFLLLISITCLWLLVISLGQWLIAQVPGAWFLLVFVLSQCVLILRIFIKVFRLSIWNHYYSESMV